jgi:hypothetical protein
MTESIKQSHQSHRTSSASASSDELGLSSAASDGSAELTQSQSSDARVAGPDVAERVGDTSSVAQQLDSDSMSPHVNPGRFQAGNVAALKHGGRRSLDRPEALIAIAGKREELTAHLGDASVIQQDLVTDYARTDVLIESVAANIEVGGIFTTKGKTRAAVSLLLSLMDRRLRLATTLGIERKPRRVETIETIMREHSEQS